MSPTIAMSGMRVARAIDELEVLRARVAAVHQPSIAIAAATARGRAGAADARARRRHDVERLVREVAREAREETQARERGDLVVHAREHLDDAASATVLAVEQKARGVFNIVDDEPAPVSEWLPYLADVRGAKPPRRVPRWLARLLAGEMAVVMMTEGRGFSNAKAKRELGWQPRYPSWRQGFKEELA